MLFQTYFRPIFLTVKENTTVSKMIHFLNNSKFLVEICSTSVEGIVVSVNKKKTEQESRKLDILPVKTSLHLSN